MEISGINTFVADPIWSQSQTRRVNLDCKTSLGAVVINLPEISTLFPLYAQNVVFSINDVDDQANVNNITINAYGTDTIDQAGSNSLVMNTSGASIVLGVGTNGKWIALESNVQGNAPATNAYGLYTQTEDSAVIEDTTDQLSIIGAGLGTLSVGANQFVKGDTFKSVIAGKKSNANNNTIEFFIKVDGVIILSSGAIALGGSTNKDWELITDFTIREIGAPGVASIHVNSRFLTQRDGGQQFEGEIFDTTNNTTFDTTQINTLDILVQWGTDSPNNSIYSDQFVLYKLF